MEYLHKPSDLVILPGVSAALKRLKEQGFRLVVCDQSAGVARGYYSESDVEQLHEYMNCLLAKDGAEIDRYFTVLIIPFMESENINTLSLPQTGYRNV